MVGVGVVEGARGRACLRLHGHDLAGQAVGGADRIAARRWVGDLVVGERRVDFRPVGVSGHHPLAVGVTGSGSRDAVEYPQHSIAVYKGEFIAGWRCRPFPRRTEAIWQIIRCTGERGKNRR